VTIDTPVGGGRLSRPRAVCVVAFAAVVSFMGPGLVDRILLAIATNLHAPPSQVELRFTSYFAFTGISMFVWSVGREPDRRQAAARRPRPDHRD
jgi:hypothetical protein